MAYVPFVIDEDLSEVKDFGGDGGGAPELPPGDFVFDVVDVKQETYKTGNAGITVTFEAVEPEEHAGKRLLGRYALTADAMGRIKRLIMACGGNVNKINSDEIMGGRIRATVIHNEGKQSTNPDGSLKTDSEGNPYPPRVFANIQNERPVEVAQPKPAAPPPVTRGKAATGNSTQTRRA